MKSCRNLNTAGPVLAAGLLAMLSLAAWPMSAGAAEPDLDVARPIRIQHTYQRGDLLRYNLRLSGQVAWTPPTDDVDGGRMTTDFTFKLRAKTPRPEGGWTFDLAGEQLRSTGENSKGKIDVTLDQNKAKIKPRGKIGVTSKKSPLERPMTMTLGPQGAFRFGTGLGPLLIYMLPQVDHRFWTLLTLAPEEDVVVGDQWNEEFEVPVPGAQGESLDVRAKWRVDGWQRYGKKKVLVIRLAARVDVEDVDLLLKNGDEIHVTSGRYTAAGKALWDVDGGKLCGATAEQELTLLADRPTRRALRGRSTYGLRLLAQQDAPPSE